jgi:phospholipid transport system substrate-binding protein
VGALGVLLSVLLVALAASAAEAPAQAQAAALEPGDAHPGPQQVIAKFDDVLLAMMKRADELGYDGRFEFVAPIVRETFDLSFMARKTVGRYWDDFSKEEQARWVKTFEDFTISNLADRFHGYSGQQFEILGEKPASKNTKIVLTLLHRTGGADDVELNYRMRQGRDGWQIIDIYANGKVSEVALRRAEYARSLKQGGIEQLIESVAEKTASRAAPAT